MDIYGFSKQYYNGIDNDVGRLQLGRDISRPRKKVDIENDVRRSRCKEKLRDGAFTHGNLFKLSVILLVKLVQIMRKTIYPPTILKMRMKK